MPDEKDSNGKNGKSVGLVDRIKTGVKEDLQSLKTDLPAKAKEQVEGLKNPTKTQLYTSLFRHKHDDPPRNRALGVLSNVFLHLHPAKINRDAVRYSYTWGMGGITFYLFIVLTLTGVMLMVFTLLLSFTGYLLPDDQLGFWAVTVGTNMARATPMLGHEGPFGAMLHMPPYNDDPLGLLGGSVVDANALLRCYIWPCLGIPIVASVLMIVHFWRVRKDGGISGPAPVMLEAEADKPRRGPKAAGE